MKLPNSYGSVIKMSGKRRKPFAVRTSAIMEYINLYAPIDVNERKSLFNAGYKWNGRIIAWVALKTDTSQKLADKLGYEYESEYKQTFTYLGYFEKRDEALNFLALYNSGYETKKPDEPTFEDIYNKWLEHKQGLKRELANGTWQHYGYAFNRLKPLHKRKFNSIKPQDIQEVINAHNDKSAGIVGNIRTVIKGMYHYAYINGYCERDISENLVFEWAEPEKELHKPYTNEEIAVLWDSLGKVENVDIILMYIYTGLRPDELLEAKTENVFVDEKYMICGKKTKYGKNRTIPLNDKILPLVKNRYNKDNEYLILSKRGTRLTYVNFVNFYHPKIMEQLGMEHLPHDGRHTFATLMDNANANVICKKMIMGHSMKGDITASVYTHKTLDDLLREVNKI